MEKKTRDNNIIPFPKKYTDPYKELHEREELIRSYNNRNKRERREPTDVDIRRKKKTKEYVHKKNDSDSCAGIRHNCSYSSRCRKFSKRKYFKFKSFSK